MANKRETKTASSSNRDVVKPLSVEEAQARPVTLGVILILATILVGMIGFVWNELRSAADALSSFKEEQGKFAIQTQTALARLSGQVDQVDKQLSNIDSQLRKPLIIQTAPNNEIK
jgi:predicted PurR-regulated permease PerM